MSMVLRHLRQYMKENKGERISLILKDNTILKKLFDYITYRFYVAFYLILLRFRCQLLIMLQMLYFCCV